VIQRQYHGKKASYGVISLYGRLRQEDGKLEASVDDRARPCLKKAKWAGKNIMERKNVMEPSFPSC
jgi:hypothetical protein